MKQQHTPGPWHVSQNDSIYAGDEFIGIALDGRPWGKELPQKSNARLMAAAPELLKALKEMYHAYLSMERPQRNKALANTRELLEKIEGNESNT